MILTSSGQKVGFKEFKNLSCAEKRWVIFHPFVAKKAYKITMEAREISNELKNDTVLKGTGNGLQIDAFRHTYWMASLTQGIGWRKSKKLGRAHERGNYKSYKKGKKEDGVLPDKISSDMDLFNNNIGIEIGKKQNIINLKETIVQLVNTGNCKIIKMDKEGNYLDCEGLIISNEFLKGKWENTKCLVNSNEVY